jgi:hypothetical protein
LTIFSPGFAAAADLVRHPSPAPPPECAKAAEADYNRPMTEEQLRLIVRETIARHLGRDPVAAPQLPGALPSWKAHPSHSRLSMPIGRDQDGPCLVEPDVKCTHCAFCQSYGH